MYYTGQLKNSDRVFEVFYSAKKPTSTTHGMLYGFVFGGYETKEKAIQVANYQGAYKVVLFDGRKKESKINRSLYAIAGIS